MCWVIPPRFRVHDGGLPNRVEQRRLPVVDVPHDRHHRRTGSEVGLAVLEGLRLFVVVRGMLDRDLALGCELCGDELDFLIGERLRDRHGLPEAHHEHDDFRCGNPEGLRQIADADTGLDRHRPGDRSDLAGRLRACGFALALLLSSVAGTCGRVVDDHASLPTLARAALAWPHGPIWSV